MRSNQGQFSHSELEFSIGGWQLSLMFCRQFSEAKTNITPDGFKRWQFNYSIYLFSFQSQMYSLKQGLQMTSRLQNKTWKQQHKKTVRTSTEHLWCEHNKTHRGWAVGSNNKAVAGVSNIMQNWLLKYCSAVDLNVSLFLHFCETVRNSSAEYTKMKVYTVKKRRDKMTKTTKGCSPWRCCR